MCMEKKSGSGTDINLEPPYAEAKAVAAITIAGWKILAASVQQAGEKLISDQRTEGCEHDDNVVESASSSEEEAVEIPNEKSYDEQDDCSISQQFQKYIQAVEVIAKRRSFYVDGNLHKILCIPDVLLLKENEYSKEQISSFGITNLEILRNSIAENHMDFVVTTT